MTKIITKEEKLNWIGNMFMWDVDDFIVKWPDYLNDWMWVIDLWIDKTDILKHQPDKCIDCVYDLFINYIKRCEME
jgi:hypothetical protein